MGSIIQIDQSYCIEDRCIKDNLILIRDLIDLAEVYSLNLGLLSLDQEKVFDKQG